MAGWGKKKHRTEAELIASYGFWPGFEMTPELRYGLWLNRDRAHAIRSAEVMRGINAAFRPDEAIADAVAEDSDQVEEFMRIWRANHEESQAMRQ